MAGTNFASGKEFKARYRTIKNLGGGMSKVLLAEDMEYKRNVVVKFFDFEARKKYNTKMVENLANRFALETEVSSQLNHPHTVRVYENGTIADTFPFITMEFVNGATLSKAIEVMREINKFKLDEFLLMFYEICDTIDVAHQKRVLNRDLKPQNIMLGKYGALKVIDWGLAKILDRPQGETAETDRNVSLLNVNAQVHTMEGMMMGTEAYMAPEQRVGAEADKRTDIYLLAGILYQGATGKPPELTKRNKVDTRKIIVPELRDIVEICLKSDPDDRYQTAGELKQAIKGLLNYIQSERYVVNAGLWSKLRRKKPTEMPEPLILSEIIKKWVRNSTKEEASGRMHSAAPKKTLPRKRRRRR